MRRRGLTICGAMLALGALALPVAGCGDSGTSQEELDEARREGVSAARQQSKIEEIEKELRRLRIANGSGGVPSSGSGGSAAAGSGGSSSCGSGVSVGPNTSCPFALSVAADYYSEIGSGPGTVETYSPTTGRYYTMSCSAGSPHVCTGGNEASVYFP